MELFWQRAIVRIWIYVNPRIIIYFYITYISYHHTGSATLMYGLREALAIFSAEGILASIYRHRACASQLQIGLESMGLEMFVDRLSDRLPTVNAVKLPLGVDWKAVSDYAMKQYMQPLFI